MDDEDDWMNNRNEKSACAIKRESRVRMNLDSFLRECVTMLATSFPTTKEIASAKEHLTDACWRTLRTHVSSIGCTVQRREITLIERALISRKYIRKGKMFVITVTVPNIYVLGKVEL